MKLYLRINERKHLLNLSYLLLVEPLFLGTITLRYYLFITLPIRLNDMVNSLRLESLLSIKYSLGPYITNWGC